jgi:hypothetical protein
MDFPIKNGSYVSLPEGKWDPFMVGLWLVNFMENPKNGGKLHMSM